ncbi:sodium:solute symporter [Pseudonocardia sp. HH130630-07]|uniref:sodium:solute symporter n=1 Tax=Pseudonocardia sp. HH130630-07 TaxID=1690815 RepID=UPI000814D72A|nr:sodium:solute symporter [Pseudonocardia sp. HH130630-07]ANY10422.1 sodium:solute symporter [Pseudonocardia sp. HH130630-07]
MRTLDLIVIVAYLVVSLGIGLWMSGRQKSNEDYFLGGRELPWWAVSLSVVATETSALTVISVPTVAYLGSLTYLQLALGYLLGRIVVAFVLLPRYAAGKLTTAYGYLGQRFGRGMQGTASVAFLVTRLLADGVRMFAAAIPVKVILAGLGLDVSFFWIIVVLSLVTVAYTYVGGIKAVVWTDVLQMVLYVVGGIVAVAVIGPQLPAGFWGDAVAAGKTQLLDFTSNPVSAPYAFVTAVVGGALLSTASHGVDQIIVQRLLACRSVRDGQKALIASAVVVGLQFALFLVVGLFLWGYYGGATPAALGLQTGDELFPRFIVEGLPPGVSGLLLAGILAAAMSTLSSSLSALSSSTVIDLVQTVFRRELSTGQGIRLARITTLVWGLVFIVFANLFTSTENPVVELGLSVAGITYGGLLGAFALGLFVPRARQSDAIVGFSVAVVVMAALFLLAPTLVGFTWYTAIGLVITVLLGFLLSLRRPAGRGTESAAGAVRSDA